MVSQAMPSEVQMSDMIRSVDTTCSGVGSFDQNKRTEAHCEPWILRGDSVANNHGRKLLGNHDVPLLYGQPRENYESESFHDFAATS